MNKAQFLLNRIDETLSLLLEYRTDNTDSIKQMWIEYNNKFFDGQMELPRLVWLPKQTIASTRKYGHWNYHKRELALSPLLLRKEEALRNVLIHEMCHQAVNEIDGLSNTHYKYDRNWNGGHGREWSDWMRKCGRPPERYTQVDEKPFTDEEQQEELRATIANKKLKTFGNTNNVTEFTEKTPVCTVSAGKSGKLFGFVICELTDDLVGCVLQSARQSRSVKVNAIKKEDLYNPTASDMEKITALIKTIYHPANSRLLTGWKADLERKYK